MTKNILIKLKFIYEDVVSIMKVPVYIARIPRTIREVSYYPEKKRKSNFNIFTDNLIWIIRNKEPNYFYNPSGLDIKDWRNINDFLPFKKFTRERDFGNSCAKESFNYNYIATLRDKYIFSSYLAYTIGKEKVIPTVALYSNNQIYLVNQKTYTSLEEFLIKDMAMFCKANDGEGSKGVFFLEKKNSVLYLNKREITLQEIKSIFKNSKIIFQDILQQHKDLNKINSASVNTIRIITVQGFSGSINIFNSFLRLGSSDDSFVDNISAGGLAVGVNENGVLDKYGFKDKAFGTKLAKHPVSNTTFEGYQLPCWTEIKELVKNAHKQFYYIQSIGWDVAITPTGPVLVEGNDNWGTSTPQIIESGLKDRWYKLKSS